MCCGRHESEVGSISWSGNCLECAISRQAENIVGIAEKRGFAYRRQQLAIIKTAQRALLDVTQQPA